MKLTGPLDWLEDLFDSGEKVIDEIFEVFKQTTINNKKGEHVCQLKSS